jgi:AcrR family transcriptional regulator
MNNLRWGLHKHYQNGHELEARERIIAAATECYKDMGMKVSCHDVADKAKVTRPTIYRYFDSMSQVRQAVVGKIWETLCPPTGSAEEWHQSLRKAQEYRLGVLPLNEAQLYLDLETVVLTQVDNPEQEGCARLFLSYLRITPLVKDPLPQFKALWPGNNQGLAGHSGNRLVDSESVLVE